MSQYFNANRSETFVTFEQLRLNESDIPTIFHQSFMFLHDDQPVWKQLSARLDDLTTLFLQSLLGFFLLISMRDDVAERLVVDVASWVDRSESKGLIHLEVYKMTVCLVRIIIVKKGLRVDCYKNKQNKPPLL